RCSALRDLPSRPSSSRSPARFPRRVIALGLNKFSTHKTLQARCLYRAGAAAPVERRRLAATGARGAYTRRKAGARDAHPHAHAPEWLYRCPEKCEKLSGWSIIISGGGLTCRSPEGVNQNV